jgi:tRNA(Ile2)-agmatinylcytidine synthase
MLKCGMKTMYYIIYVGIDDTDSSEGMCTTYISAVIMDELKDYGFQIMGYPRLIRLNPFARFKTRGNGAVSFKLLVKSVEEFEEAKNIILNRVKQLSHLHEENTNPGVVFFKVKTDAPKSKIQLPDKLKYYAINTVQYMVTIKEAEKLANEIGAEFYKIKKGRGIIGALAAIGCPLDDSTFELLGTKSSLTGGRVSAGTTSVNTSR